MHFIIFTIQLSDVERGGGTGEWKQKHNVIGDIQKPVVICIIFTNHK